ncbi:MAG: hypothetical protein OEZ06_13270 [Myxococcales bacterium]|nr:hypothetical protein [Myxococcales bacterium]
MSRLRLMLFWALLLLAGCAEDDGALLIAQPDRAQFEAEVYPVLLRDCGFDQCHASRERFFQVFGPGRARYSPDLRSLDPPGMAELDHSYQRARSMIDPVNPQASLLLVKPLSVQAGGAGHQGIDSLGRDVYQFDADPSYLVLLNWVLTSAGVPTAGATPQPTPQPGPLPVPAQP